MFVLWGYIRVKPQMGCSGKQNGGHAKYKQNIVDNILTGPNGTFIQQKSKIGSLFIVDLQSKGRSTVSKN